MAHHQQIRKTIVELLSNMNDSKEVRTYLQRFSGLQVDRFAVIKIGGSVLEEELEATATALACLQQVGLTPVVVHGGGPQLDVALAAQNITTAKVNGLRVTTPAVLDVARNVFLKQNLKLVEAVRAQGVEAHTLNSGVIEAEIIDEQALGFVGAAKGIQQQLIRSVIDSGAIPILTCLGVAPGGQLVNINGDAVVAALVDVLQPMKIVFLTGVGGLLDAQGSVIDSINLTTDFSRLMTEDWVHSGMRLKLTEIKSLLDDLPLESSISIIKPGALIKELFTHGGAGTNIRRGEGVRTIATRAQLDGARLCALMEEGFERPLKPQWYASLDLYKAIVSDAYRAGAVLTKLEEVGGIVYLDKFTVCESARGEGLARAVWRQLCDQNPCFFFRSRTENGFNNFYKAQCDGAIRHGKWTVFWKGDVDLAGIAPIVSHITQLPESFAT